MPYELNQKKNIAILGYGSEGKATYTFLTEQKKIDPQDITILDSTQEIETPLGSKKTLGENYLTGINQYDIIIRSSGISPHKKELQQYISHGGKLISHMALFFSVYSGKIIGITGTKGKTTITQLIYNILQRAKFDVEIIGNIGKPALTSINREKPPAYVVCELSSYMLEDTNPQCEIAILSNLYHEHHADRHGGLAAYHHAKRNITHYAKHIVIGSQIKEFPITIKKHSTFGYQGKYLISNNALFLGKKKIINTEEIKLLGEHNQYNICAALAVCDVLHLSLQYFIEEIKTFGGVEHRLEYAGTYNQIHRYNDAIASTPESTIAALQSLPTTQTLFLGGKEGGYSFEELLFAIQDSNIKNIVLYPETGKKLRPLLEKKHNCYFTTDFEDGIKRANKNTSPDGIALLSCGAAYTLSIPFVEKGNRFKQLIQTF